MQFGGIGRRYFPVLSEEEFSIAKNGILKKL